MSKNHGPRIVTNGLKLCLESSFVGRSYPGSGYTWYDLSGQHNDGSLINGASYINNAMVFDGTNDRISVSPINIYQKSYSICAWIKRKSGTAAQGIMSDSQYSYWGLLINPESKLQMRHWYSENPYLNNVVSSINVVAGDWTHVAGVFDIDSGMKLYINGVLDNSNTITGASVLPNGRGPEHIGQYRDNAGNLETNVMNGSIASLQFYDRALSNSEIYQNYISTKNKYVDIPYYDEGANCIPYLSNWDNQIITYMGEMGQYNNVVSHGYVDGPETYNLTLNNLPAHSQIRYKCVWHFADSLDNETSYLYTSDSSNVLTERARFTKTVNSNPPSFSVLNGVEYYWSGIGYPYTINSPTWSNEGFVIFDTDYYDHSLSSFSARHILGADQPQSDEAMYLSHVQVYLK
jgi:hypothetical protein